MILRCALCYDRFEEALTIINGAAVCAPHIAVVAAWPPFRDMAALITQPPPRPSDD